MEQTPNSKWYAPIDQCGGKFSELNDIYAFGAICLEMILNRDIWGNDHNAYLDN